MEYSRNLLDLKVIVIWQDNIDNHKSDVSVGDNFEALSSFADADQKGEVDKGMINLDSSELFTIPSFFLKYLNSIET